MMRQRGGLIGALATLAAVAAGASHHQTDFPELAWMSGQRHHPELFAGRTGDDGHRRPWKIAAYTSNVERNPHLRPVPGGLSSRCGPGDDTFLEGIDDEVVMPDDGLLLCALDQPGYG